MEVFVTKAIIGIQSIKDEPDSLFSEVQEFMIVERALKDYGQKCYLSVALHIFNYIKRMVLFYLMQDPFPFADNTFSRLMKEYIFEFRKLDFDPYDYNEIVEVLSVNIPE